MQAEREGEDAGNRHGRRLHPGAFGIGVLLGGALWAIGTRGFTWLATHPFRVPVFRPPGETLPLHEVSFRTSDGLQIRGWFVPAPGAAGTVILCHGHPMNRLEMLPWARLLHAAGFHTLLFDFRAMGRSEGDLCTIGRYEVNDLRGAVDYLQGRPDTRSLPIGVYGISMGGAVSLIAAAQDGRIAAVATHGAYATLHRAIRQRGRLLLGPAGPAFAAAISYWGRHWLDENAREVSPLNLIAHIAPRPVLITHGRRDMTIHPSDARALYAAAGRPKSLRILRHSWHVRIGRRDRADYDRLLQQFFRDHLT